MAASFPVTAALPPQLGALSDASPAFAATFVVNSTLDLPDDNPGDGVCLATPVSPPGPPVCTLRAAIMQANATPGPDIITLPVGIYTLSVGGPGEDGAAGGDLDILQSVSINGGGRDTTIVEAGDAPTTGIDRVFQVRNAGTTATFNNMTIRHGTLASGDGAGILVDAVGAPSLVLNNTVVGDNVNNGSGNGGGVWSGGPVTLMGSTLGGDQDSGMQAYGNTVNTGGGAGIYMQNAALTLTNSSVLNNFAMDSGGGIWQEQSTLTLTNTFVMGNIAGGFGGGIYATGAVTIQSGSNILNNANDLSGGGLYLGTRGATISDSTFRGNDGRTGGGAIANNAASNETTTLTNVTLEANSSCGNGAGILNGATKLVLQNTTLTSNDAFAGMCESSELVQGGGISNAFGGTVTLDGATEFPTVLNGNSADGGGGVANEGRLNVLNAQVSGNYAWNGVGGGIWNKGAGSVVTTGAASLLSGNYASQSGGALHNEGAAGSSGSATLTGTTIQVNNADGDGAGISNAGTLTLTNGYLYGNGALGLGGGVVNSAGSAAISDTIFEANDAVNGGGLGVSGGTMTVDRSSLQGNTSGQNGAGFTQSGGTLAMRASTLSGGVVENKQLQGDGAYTPLADQEAARNLQVGGLLEGGGGALYGGTTHLTNVTISGNRVVGGGRGGGLDIGAGAGANLSFITLQDNDAASGSAIFNMHPAAKLKNSAIIANTGTNCWNDPGAIIQSGGYNVADDSSCMLGGPGDLQDDTVPPLAPLGNYGGPTQTHRPPAGPPPHPIVDRVPAANCTDYSGANVDKDQRGVARPQGSNCDSGAFEAEPPAALQFSSSSYSAGEGAGNATLTVVRTGGTAEAISVGYYVQSGTATRNADFTGPDIESPSRIAWSAGETASKTITIPITDDGAYEQPDETFQVVLTGASGAILVSPSTATVTIVDNDSAPTLALSSSTYSQTENNESVTITVARTGSSVGAVSVNYATSDGTAAAGTDYTSASGTLNWADGDAANKNFAVSILPDGAHEADETFTVTLSGPSGGGGAVLGSPSSATVTITDDDPAPSLQLSSATYSVVEGVAGVTITVTRTGSSVGAVSVDYASADGTATAGSDYTTTTGTLNWANGDSGNKTFSVPIINDAAVESAETFTVALSNPGGPGAPVVGTPSSATVTIDDEDSVLQFSSATYSLSEASGPAVLTVTRVGATLGPVSVDYATQDGTAAAGSDYTTATGTLSWPAGDATSKTISVPVSNDGLVEPAETFTAILSNPTGSAAIGTPGTATVTINNDDATYEFTQSSYSVGEAGTSVTLTVTRTGATTNAGSLDYTTSDGTALAGSDYTATSGTLNWAAGDGASKTIVVAITNDAAVESAETFTVTLSNPAGGALGSPVVASVTIFDEDVTLQFSAATTSLAEGAGPAVVTVTRLGSTANAVSVNFATQDGTALAGSDYTSTSGTLNWNSEDGSSKTISVTLTDDGLVESAESFTVTLSSPGGGATLGSPATATVTITNDDSSIQFSAATQTVGEAAGTASLTVTRLGDTTAAVTADYATSDGTALAGSDYTATSGTLSWAAGDATPQVISVPVTNDAVVEVSEAFTVTLSNTTGGAVLGAPSSATVNITDDDVMLQFSQASYNVGEGAGPAVLMVLRVGSTTNAVAVDYGTTAGTATAGSDYTTTSGTLNWSAGDGSSKTISVPITDDSLVDPGESFTVTLTNPSGGATLGSPTTATVGISDNDTMVQFSPAGYAANEAGSTVTLSVSRIGVVGNGTTVDYTTQDGAALAGSDYTATSGTLSWAGGDAGPKTITVTILNDSVVEPGEAFTVVLSNPSGATLGATPTGTVTITDDDVTVQFAAGGLTLSEASGPAGMTVTRVGATANAVTVDFTTQNGTAQAPSDYTTTSGTLSWAAGDSGAQVISVPLVDDALVEPTQSFTIVLSNPTGATLGSQSTATITITDDDTSLQFAAGTLTVAEGATSADLTVTRLGNFAAAVTVDYTTADVTAAAGFDYTSSTGTLTWAAGDGASKTISVPLVNNTVVESDETFTVTLSNPGGGAVLGSQATATVTITDDDSTLQFTAATVSVNEPGGSAAVTVSRVGTASGAVTVNYATADGTATAGSDYGAASGTLSWADGDSGDKTINFALLDDGVVEPSENMTVTLSSPTGNASLGGPATITVTIMDNDATVEFNAAAYAAGEADGSVVLTVTRTGATTGAITVNYASSDGTAVAPGDYTATAGTLTWADGDGSSKTITVPITNNTTVEPSEAFTVSLTGPVGALLGARPTATVTITDDDSTLQFAASGLTLSEPSGPAGMTVSRIGSSASAVTVDFTTQDGTAVAGSDYTTTSGTLTWAAGDGSDKVVSVPLVDDSLVEPTEAFTIVLSNPTGGATLGGQTSVTITVTDDDTSLQFSAATLSVAEGATSADLTVTRLGNTTPGVTVNYATADASALAGSDYASSAGTLTWTAGDGTSKTISVPLVHDTLVEADETFTVTLSNPGGGAVLGSQTASTVTITDDDSTLQFTAATASVNEPGESAVVTVSRVGTASGAVTVNYATADGTATAGSDYGAASGTLSWADGDNADKTINFTLLDDAVVEPSETLTVTLTNPTGNASLGAAPSITVTIIDDDTSLQFSAATYTVAEGAGTGVLTVTRLGSSVAAVTADYSTADGTALAGTDYTATAGTLSWAAGDGADKTISVPIFNDPLVEGGESFTVNLGKATGGASIGAPFNATVTITDDDTVPMLVQFAATSVAVQEAAGTALLTVTRTGPIGVAITVDYATQDGAALAGTDYTTTTGTLTWALNDGTDKTITVPLLNDSLNESAESFSVTLTNPTGGAALGTPATVSVEITDDDLPAGGGGGGGPSSPPSPPPPGPPPGEPPGPTAPGPVNDAPVTPDSDTSIGVGGGAINDGGVSVVIRSGSVETPVGMTVNTGTGGGGLTANGGTLLNKTVEVSVEDTGTSSVRTRGDVADLFAKFSVFSVKKPAEVIINLTKEELGSFNVRDLRGGRVENGVIVNQMPTRIVNEADAIIAIWTDHFSKFSVFSVNTPVPTSAAPYEQQLTGLGTRLEWTNPPGTMQYQLQVIPFNQDGPGINLVRNAETSYTVLPPDFGGADANYVMLPGMTYQWRVRTTSSAKPPSQLEEQDWGAWDVKLFKTAAVSAKTIDRVAPQAQEVVSSLTPTLQWSNSEKQVFYYEVQVSKDEQFGPNAYLYSELRHGGATTPLNSYTIPGSNPLEADTQYYWRVRPRVQGDGKEVAWSATFQFRTPAAP